MRRVATLLRSIASRLDGAQVSTTAWSGEDVPALDGDEGDIAALLAAAVARGGLRVGDRVAPVETRPSWRLTNDRGGGVTAWRIGRSIAYLRYAPSEGDSEEAGAMTARGSSDLWTSLIETAPDARWVFIHDLRSIRSIPRRTRGLGVAAYRAVLPRLRRSVAIVPPALEPVARTISALFLFEGHRVCDVGHRAADAIREGLEGDGAPSLPALDGDAERRWSDALFASDRAEIAGVAVPVHAPRGWRMETSRLRVRLALIDGRVLLSHLVGTPRVDDLEPVAACFDAVRAEVGGAVSEHVCDLRGLVGADLPTIRATLRVFTPTRLRWLRRSTHLVAPSLRLVVRLFDVVYPRALDNRVTLDPLPDALAAALGLRQGRHDDIAGLEASQYREAIERAMGALAHLASDGDAPIAPPSFADPLVRDLFHALTLVQADAHGLTRSLLEANAGLEVGIAARTRDLARAKAEAEALAADKQRLLSTMSHEIRTPLHGITSTVALLRDARLDAEQSELVRTLSFSAEHLTALVDDLLDWARVDGDVHDLGAVSCDLETLVRDVVTSLQGGAAAREVALRVRVAPGFPPAVLANPVRLRQVFYNLVGNAVKFTARGSVDVDLDVDDTHTLRVRVRDTGIGIDPRHHPRLFEPFSPAARETAQRYGGTGLGLAITRRIVALHGGDISVESDAGRGSTFTVVLPFRVAPRGAGTSSAPRPNDLGGMRVILAEDNPTIQLVTSRLLRRWRADVTVVDDGQQCLDQLARGAVDAVLMDLQMPVLDGYEATARIRADARAEVRGMPIIALTADASAEARAQALARGVDAVMTKPYRPEDLFNALTSLRAR